MANPWDSDAIVQPAKAAAPDPLDYTDKFNTKLAGADEARFQGWIKTQSEKVGRDLSRDLGDYDLRGQFKDTKGAEIEPGHGTDKWKKPNHPTFSNESIYHGKDGFEGGSWGDGTFTPGATNLKLRKPEDLQGYFKDREPDVRLVLPTKAAAMPWDNDPIVKPEPSDKSRFMAGQVAPDRPRWDVGGDIGRVFNEGVEGVKRNVAEAFPSYEETAKRREEGFLSGLTHDVERAGALASIPFNALRAFPGSLIEGPLKATVGSALSYLPGMTRENTDRAVEMSLMGLRPRAGGGPTAPRIEAPSPAATVNALSPEAMAQAAATVPVPVRPGTPAVRPPPLSPEGMAVAAEAPQQAPPNAAIREVVRRMEQDAKGGGLTAEQMLAEQAKTPGKPLTLADLGGENLRGLAGNVARSPGEGRQIIKGALESRDAAAPTRLRQNLDAALGEGTAYEAGTTLAKQRETAAQPLYEKYRAAPPMTPDAMEPTGDIGKLLSRPSMRAGMANALKIAAEKGVDPKTLGIALDEAGEPRFTKVPTWETMDFVKAGVDDVVEAYRDPTTGKLNLDRYGSAANQTRADLIKSIDKMNPNYAQARAAWGGPSQSIDVIRFGRDALKNEPEANAARLASMSPADREFARIGLKAELVERMEGAGPTADEARRIMGNEGMRRKIAPFFRSEAEGTQFLADVAAEGRMFRTGYDVLGNSKTAGRQAEDAHSLLDAAGHAIHAGVHAAGGNYFAVARGVRGALNALGDLRRNPEINAEIARLIFEPIVGGDKPSAGMKLLQDYASYKDAKAAQAAQRADAQQNFMRQYARQPQMPPLRTTGQP